MPDKVHTLLNFWFGDFGQADLPSSDRTNLWFGESEKLKEMITQTFGKDYQEVIEGKHIDWAQTPRGRLALIILYDQFSRYLHRNSSHAFYYDKMAQELR